MFKDLARWWRLRGHEHDWRMADVLGSPAKYCDECHEWTQISAQEFYALFGKHFESLKNNFYAR